MISLKIFFEVKIFTKLWYLKNLEVKFLNFLQNNKVENILNIKTGEQEKDKVSKIFDDFLIDHWCEKVLKIIKN